MDSIYAACLIGYYLDYAGTNSCKIEKIKIINFSPLEIILEGMNRGIERMIRHEIRFV